MDKPSFKIVPYEGRYAPAVRECALAAWRFTYHHIFSPERIDELVAKFYSEEKNAQAEELLSRDLMRFSLAIKEGGVLIGFHSASIHLLNPEVTRLYLHPEWIGKGVGSTLLRDAEDFFIRNGFGYYQLKVHRRNVLGQKFYERKGFVFVGEDNDDHFILKKHLRPFERNEWPA